MKKFHGIEKDAMGFFIAIQTFLKQISVKKKVGGSFHEPAKISQNLIWNNYFLAPFHGLVASECCSWNAPVELELEIVDES